MPPHSPRNRVPGEWLPIETAPIENFTSERPRNAQVYESRAKHLYWQITYWPRCAILLAFYRRLPSNMSFSATMRGIVRYQVRPHWLRAN